MSSTCCFAKTRFETRAKGGPQKATFTNSCEFSTQYSSSTVVMETHACSE